MEVTARDFAQTLELCERFGIEHTAVGRHRGGSRGGKAVGLVSRSLALARWARGRRFDVAIGHGSNDVTVAAALLRIPSATAFDYEFAVAQHNVNCRLARAVVVPDAIPPERLYRYGARGKLRRYAGPQGGVLPGGLRARRGGAPRALARPRPSRSWSSAPHPTCRSTTASRTPCSAACSTAWPPVPPRRWCCRARRSSAARCSRAARFVVPERADRRAEPRGLRRPRDLGRRHHEPRGRGARHARLHDLRGPPRSGGRAAARGGPAARLANPDEIVLERRAAQGGLRTRRDPRELVTLLLSATRTS